MTLLSAWGLEDIALVGTTKKRKRIGKVSHVLFHSSEPRAIGFEIRRPRIAYLWDRKDIFVAMDRVEIGDDEISIPDKRAATGSAAAKRLGVAWDDSVIWRGMPVLTESGTELGTVRDVVFELETGVVDRVEITTGLAADAALGRREVKLADIVRFDGEVVRVKDSATKDFSGGAAAVAGRTTAVATDAATRAAKTAAVYGKAAARMARDSEAGKKAIGWLKRAKDATIDAMQAPEDEE